MAEKNYITDITQKAIIEHNNKILLVHDSEDALWEIPGGRLNEGESLSEGLTREMQEEVGVDVNSLGVFDVFAFTSESGRNHFAIIYRCELLSAIEDVQPNEEVSQVCWVGAEDISNFPMRPEYRKILNSYFELSITIRAR
jgi:ADP-ribose pyrophosphatase YjhB (NUDIX family)